MSNENEIVVAQAGYMSPVVSVKDALIAFQAKKDLIDSIMKPNVDYGIIPGTSKNTLLKAGAEKATSFFGLSPRFRDAVVVEDFTGKDHDGEPFFFYRRTCELWRGNHIVASVDGSCNSFEKKYRYRGGERVCPECGKPAIKKSKFPPKTDPKAQPGFYCYSKVGGCGMEFSATDPAIVNQELGQVKNPDVADLANTILKMADKRALVAATLIATGMSEYFTQDVEDFIQGDFVEVTKPEPKQAENVNQETGEISEPVRVAKGQPITAEDWETFGKLVQRATDAGIKLPEYKRAEMTPAQVNGATKYIEGKLAKA
jgi:hypothetical protein